MNSNNVTTAVVKVKLTEGNNQIIIDFEKSIDVVSLWTNGKGTAIEMSIRELLNTTDEQTKREYYFGIVETIEKYCPVKALKQQASAMKGELLKRINSDYIDVNNNNDNNIKNGQPGDIKNGNHNCRTSSIEIILIATPVLFLAMTIP